MSTIGRRGFLGLLSAFVAFARLWLPRPQPLAYVVPVSEPLIDPRSQGNFSVTVNAPGRVPVTEYGTWTMVKGQLVESA